MKRAGRDAGRHPRGGDKEPEDREPGGGDRAPESRDEWLVDEAAKDSFPASDPPSWTLGRSKRPPEDHRG